MRGAFGSGCFTFCIALTAACGGQGATGTGGAGGSGAQGTSASTGAGPSGTTTATGTAATTGTSTGTGTPGGDPCSGNAYTPTAPTTTQGTEPAGASADQHQARLDVDALRNLLGLHPIDFDAALNQASQAHSDYCSVDASWCPGWHQESPGHPGFTGASFSERDATAGYSGGPRFEVMASGLGPDGSIQEWLDTVYHRTPFITPDMGQAGFGHASAFDTMDFGASSAADPAFVTNYPVHGQANVPTQWSGNEGPQPPAPSGGFPSGPVVSVVFPSSSGVHIVKHQIFDGSCNALSHVAGGADLPDVGFQAGFLGPTIALYTDKPLASGAEYTVNVEYELSGSPGHRTFKFKTQ
jgi:uncharacterized protein YkwD